MSSLKGSVANQRRITFYIQVDNGLIKERQPAKVDFDNVVSLFCEARTASLRARPVRISCPWRKRHASVADQIEQASVSIFLHISAQPALKSGSRTSTGVALLGTRATWRANFYSQTLQFEFRRENSPRRRKERIEVNRIIYDELGVLFCVRLSTRTSMKALIQASKTVGGQKALVLGLFRTHGKLVTPERDPCASMTQKTSCQSSRETRPGSDLC